MERETRQRANRYDLLRLVFAAIVFSAHAIQLPDISVPKAFLDVLLEIGEVSIRGFFVISGALVLGSLERSSSMSGYAAKRARRLYPAYAVIVLLPALVAILLVPEARANLMEVGKYLAANLVFLNFLSPNLPGVFETNRFTEINGALWTVKVEVMFYIALPVLVWMLKKAGRARIALLICIYIAAEIWRIGIGHIGMERGSGFIIQVSRQLPGQMSFFVAGMLAWEYRQLLREKWLIAGLAGALMLAVSYLPFAEPLRAAGIALLVTTIATAPGPKLNAARYGDFSYGIYGWHFPILQTITALGVFQISAAMGFAAAAVCTLITAILTWYLIEKPFLTENNWYRRKSRND